MLYFCINTGFDSLSTVTAIVQALLLDFARFLLVLFNIKPLLLLVLDLINLPFVAKSGSVSIVVDEWRRAFSLQILEVTHINVVNFGFVSILLVSDAEETLVLKQVYRPFTLSVVLSEVVLWQRKPSWLSHSKGLNC